MRDVKQRDPVGSVCVSRNRKWDLRFKFDNKLIKTKVNYAGAAVKRTEKSVNTKFIFFSLLPISFGEWLIQWDADRNRWLAMFPKWRTNQSIMAGADEKLSIRNESREGEEKSGSTINRRTYITLDSSKTVKTESIRTIKVTLEQQLPQQGIYKC